jgi:hypothetical protein
MIGYGIVAKFENTPSWAPRLKCLCQIVSPKRMVPDMEAKIGAKAEVIEKDPARFGYSSALTEIDRVRAPILIIDGRNDNSPPSIIDVYVKSCAYWESRWKHT